MGTTEVEADVCVCVFAPLADPNEKHWQLGASLSLQACDVWMCERLMCIYVGERERTEGQYKVEGERKARQKHCSIHRINILAPNT